MALSALKSLATGKKGARKPMTNLELRGEFENSIPIISVLMKRGFYSFDSEYSYELFRSRNGLEYTALDVDGRGIPSLYITDDVTSLGSWKSDLPCFLTFKFVVLPAHKPGPNVDCQLEVERNGLCLYRIPFYEIYRGIGENYIFSFSALRDRSKNFTISHLSSNISNVNVRWRDCKSITGEYDDYSLQVTNKVLGEHKGGPGESEVPVIAYYSRANRDSRYPKLFKQATLYVGNKTNEAVLLFTPRNIELITYQALLVHYLEYQERERRVDRSQTRWSSWL